MTTPFISMDVRHVGDGAAVVDIKGDVTATCEEPLMAAYEQASVGGTQRLVLNFTGLEYMNSSGIGMLVTLLVRANRHKQKLAVYGLTDHYRQIFELTRLDEAIGVFDDEPTALMYGSAS
jgi:anti-anti-sigma factor